MSFHGEIKDEDGLLLWDQHGAGEREDKALKWLTWLVVHPSPDMSIAEVDINYIPSGMYCMSTSAMQLIPYSDSLGITKRIGFRNQLLFDFDGTSRLQFRR